MGFLRFSVFFAILLAQAISHRSCNELYNCHECIRNSVCFFAKMKPYNKLECIEKLNFDPKLVKTSYRNEKECLRLDAKLQLQADAKLLPPTSPRPISSTDTVQIPTEPNIITLQPTNPVPFVESTTDPAKTEFFQTELDETTTVVVESSKELSFSSSPPPTPASRDAEIEENPTPLPVTTVIPPFSTSIINDFMHDETTPNNMEMQETTTEDPISSATTATAVQTQMNVVDDDDAGEKIPIPFPAVPLSVKFPFLPVQPNEITSGLGVEMHAGENVVTAQLEGEFSLALNCNGWNRTSPLIQLQLTACRLLSLSTRESLPLYENFIKFALANPMLNRGDLCIKIQFQKKNC